MADNTTKHIAEQRILPILTIENAVQAQAIGAGLVDGGLPVAEVTLRTEFAFDALRLMSATGDLLVGAGTVCSVDDARRAVDSGARFIVSPGFQPAVVTWCQHQRIPVIPGVATPTEALAVRDLGITTAKFFPAKVFGGPSWLAALASPLAGMQFIATGGVRGETMSDYLSQPNVAAVGGSWFIPSTAAPTTREVADRAAAVMAQVRNLFPAGGSSHD